MVRFGSLFAGIGGIDLGLERAGMQCIWQVERDRYAAKVLRKHWPNVPQFVDVRFFGYADVEGQPVSPQHAEASGLSCDLIAAGFPCQDISNAGNRAGIRGAKSGLFAEVIRVADVLKPRWLLLENVAALLNRGLDVVLGELAAIGYDAEWHCIPAASVGAPHIRDRVFIVADTGGEGLEIGQGIGSDIAAELSTVVGTGWWATEPGVGRVAHGVPSRVDRIRGLGNAVVPQIAEVIGRAIMTAGSKQTARAAW